jgi:hypothetical protein
MTPKEQQMKLAKLTKAELLAKIERNKQVAATFAATEPGSLHKACGVPKGKTIPVAKLKWALTHLRNPKLRAKAALCLRIHHPNAA